MIPAHLLPLLGTLCRTSGVQAASHDHTQLLMPTQHAVCASPMVQETPLQAANLGRLAVQMSQATASCQ
jgi:hypothetical protein